MLAVPQPILQAFCLINKNVMQTISWQLQNNAQARVAQSIAFSDEFQTMPSDRK